jgi:hypothetical protein
MMARPRKYRPPDVLAGDLTDALRTLRRGFGADQVVVLTLTRHDTPAQLERTHRLFELCPEFEGDDEQ